jgi:hypothetical protein
MSNNGVKSESASSISLRQVPLRAAAKMCGKSSCLSVAPSSTNRSNTLSRDPWGSQPSRSILLTTTMGCKFSSRAFCSTKRVCAMGPSKASTTRKHAVDGGQHALDLAAEVGVSGGVDDVDEVALVRDRRVLGQDRDATFPFEIIVVHHALGDFLVLAEGASLTEELVDEGGLPVVDVGDDGDVADLAGFNHGGRQNSSRPGIACGISVAGAPGPSLGETIPGLLNTVFRGLEGVRFRVGSEGETPWRRDRKRPWIREVRGETSACVWSEQAEIHLRSWVYPK